EGWQRLATFRRYSHQRLWPQAAFFRCKSEYASSGCFWEMWAETSSATCSTDFPDALNCWSQLRHSNVSGSYLATFNLSWFISAPRSGLASTPSILTPVPGLPDRGADMNQD